MDAAVAQVTPRRAVGGRGALQIQHARAGLVFLLRQPTQGLSPRDELHLRWPPTHRRGRPDRALRPRSQSPEPPRPTRRRRVELHLHVGDPHGAALVPGGLRRRRRGRQQPLRRLDGASPRTTLDLLGGAAPAHDTHPASPRGDGQRRGRWSMEHGPVPSPLRRADRRPTPCARRSTRQDEHPVQLWPPTRGPGAGSDERQRPGSKLQRQLLRARSRLGERRVPAARPE